MNEDELADLLATQQQSPWQQAKARVRRKVARGLAWLAGLAVLSAAGGLLAGGQPGLVRWLILTSPVWLVALAIAGHTWWLHFETSRATPLVEEDAEPGQPDLATPGHPWPGYLAKPTQASRATQPTQPIRPARQPAALPTVTVTVHPLPAEPRPLEPVRRKEPTDGQ